MMRIIPPKKHARLVISRGVFVRPHDAVKPLRRARGEREKARYLV
jgi:hypothetical protein